MKAAWYRGQAAFNNEQEAYNMREESPPRDLLDRAESELRALGAPPGCETVGGFYWEVTPWK
jgi:hypothetical protein